MSEAAIQQLISGGLGLATIVVTAWANNRFGRRGTTTAPPTGPEGEQAGDGTPPPGAGSSRP